MKCEFWERKNEIHGDIHVYMYYYVQENGEENVFYNALDKIQDNNT